MPPRATPKGSTSGPRRHLAPGNCSHCGVDHTMTTIWRTGPNQERLCNACGLYVQTHGRMRPLGSLGLHGRKRGTGSASATSSPAGPAQLMTKAAKTAGRRASLPAGSVAAQPSPAAVKKETMTGAAGGSSDSGDASGSTTTTTTTTWKTPRISLTTSGGKISVSTTASTSTSSNTGPAEASTSAPTTSLPPPPTSTSPTTTARQRRAGKTRSSITGGRSSIGAFQQAGVSSGGDSGKAGVGTIVSTPWSLPIGGGGGRPSSSVTSPFRSRSLVSPTADPTMSRTTAGDEEESREAETDGDRPVNYHDIDDIKPLEGAEVMIGPMPRPGRTFTCHGFEPCAMTFARSEHLARHIRSKHTGEKPYVCHCNRTFSRIDNLRQHCSIVHVNQPEKNELLLDSLASRSRLSLDGNATRPSMVVGAATELRSAPTTAMTPLPSSSSGKLVVRIGRGRKKSISTESTTPGPKSEALVRAVDPHPKVGVVVAPATVVLVDKDSHCGIPRLGRPRASSQSISGATYAPRSKPAALRFAMEGELAFLRSLVSGGEIVFDGVDHVDDDDDHHFDAMGRRARRRSSAASFSVSFSRSSSSRQNGDEGDDRAESRERDEDRIELGDGGSDQNVGSDKEDDEGSVVASMVSEGGGGGSRKRGASHEVDAAPDDGPRSAKQSRLASPTSNDEGDDNEDEDDDEEEDEDEEEEEDEDEDEDEDEEEEDDEEGEEDGDDEMHAATGSPSPSSAADRGNLGIPSPEKEPTQAEKVVMEVS